MARVGVDNSSQLIVLHRPPFWDTATRDVFFTVKGTHDLSAGKACTMSCIAGTANAWAEEVGMSTWPVMEALPGSPALAKRQSAEETRAGRLAEDTLS